MSELFSATGTISLTIPSGAAVSGDLNCTQTIYDAEAVLVRAPAALDALTYTYEVSNDGGVSYVTLQDVAGVDTKVPAAGKGILYNGIFTAITNLRIKASGNAAADRIFKFSKSFRT